MSSSASRPTLPVILVFDTETTGIPPEDPTGKCKYAPYKKWGNQCRLLQLAWQVRNSHGELLECENRVVFPDPDVVIPEESIAVHGISLEWICSKENDGIRKPLKEVLDDFMGVFQRFQIDTIVAHNLSFDYHIINHELYKLTTSPPPIWKTIPGYCTYRQGRRYLKQQGIYISGKLVSYFSHFVEPWEQSALKQEAILHHADSDVEVCWRVFERLYPLQPPALPSS